MDSRRRPMIDERTVLLTLGGTLALGVLVIAYLQEPLRRVLFDICRKRDHARFWASCANVLILAIPVAVELLLIDIRPWTESNLFSLLPHATSPPPRPALPPILLPS